MAKLSAAEKYLVNLIQAQRSKVQKMSITQLSEYANVSTATVVRTAKKLGYSGFTEFRHALAHPDQKSPEYAILRQVDSKIKQVILQNQVEMERTIENLNEATIDEAIMQIQKAAAVYVFARGLSEMIAEEVTLKLQLVGKYAEMFRDPNIIMTIARRIRPGSVVLIITLNGETPELVAAAKILDQNDVPIVTFTTNGEAPIIQYTDTLFLGFQSKTTYFSEYEVHSRLPLQIMTRILLDAYVVRTT
ncbi:MurR/RpiR family transcriptional regulator [Schleiferilactobacillus perolens]|jgi:DNA-binding MurR/RpiR family transcriptional regulator|uniref:RpiR-like protein n=1 Tax=Schleiferilactobacillus perolens DSM 12744 TaxID=1423792 RepID=A0A0R1NAJ0_9LACO|nr:MurR/RpiR family transcriptional regulator [Schleiferilactobacillus perolens]KRL14083.1 RpiR-like protein [Schleiferilactobacillus perolens DSM 12744]MCI1890740.1 MurR/RpiR family transcriptional regulator [Schleiferilactobacillus harbinensis]MCI1912238.1 MurR/RpiR family transcriptional regulator [Schleiferilactobacillus harbinensis]MCI2171895.1 MurR/RpiR family transcriptional regulator [Schleiferilactobacillus perolens]